MNHDMILEKVTQVIQSSLNTGPISLNRDSRAMDVRGWDSLSHTVIMMSIEDAFNCELPMDRVFELKNVGELVDLIAELLTAQSVASE